MRFALKQRTRAFTLVEMLVVITIIGILAAILIPALNASRESARRTVCMQKMRECAKAILTYETAKRELPASRTYETRSMGAFVINWAPPVLPMLERKDVYDIFRDPSVNPTSSALAMFVEELACPSDPSDGADIPQLSYVVNGGRANTSAAIGSFPANHDWRENGVFDDLGGAPGDYQPSKRMRLSWMANKDGSGTTIMLSENVNARFWNVAPTEADACLLWQPNLNNALGINKDADESAPLDVNHSRPSSRHRGGVNIAFCDQRTEFISEEVDYKVYALLMTSHGQQARDPGTSSPVPNPPWQRDQVTDDDIYP